jgi:hypothetical protein
VKQQGATKQIKFLPQQILLQESQVSISLVKLVAVTQMLIVKVAGSVVVVDVWMGLLGVPKHLILVILVLESGDLIVVQVLLVIQEKKQDIEKL